MKKILSVLLLAAMLVSCVMPSLVSAAEKTLSLSVDGPATLSAADKSVELTIKLGENDDSGIWGATIAVAYTKGWTVETIANGGLWEESEFTSSTTPDPAAYKNVNIDGEKYDVALIHVEKDAVTDKVTENGSLAVVTLNAPETLAEGDTLEVKLAYDEKDPMTVGANGEIIDVGFEVADYSASVPESYKVTAVASCNGAFPEQTVTVDVSLAEDFPEVRSWAYSNLTYDKDVLELVEAEWNLPVKPVMDTHDTEAGTGVATTSQNVKITAPILRFTFKVVAEGATTAKVSLSLAVKTKPEGGSETYVVENKPVAVEAVLVILYDVDGNGVVDTDDVFYFLDCVMDDAPANSYNQDVDFDGNGTIDSDDVFALLDIVMDL